MRKFLSLIIPVFTALGLGASAPEISPGLTLAATDGSGVSTLGSFSLAAPGSEKIEPLSVRATLSASSISSGVPLLSGAMAKAPSAAAIAAESYVAIDRTFNGDDHAAAMTLTRQEGSSKKYTMSNIFNLNKPINLEIDLRYGKVSIPAQAFYTHPLYGEVSICPMTFDIVNGEVKGMHYSKTGTIEGTIDEKGNITLGGWGLMFTGRPDLEGAGINFMLSSRWQAANLRATGSRTNQKGTQQVDYQVYMEPMGDNCVRIYCLSGVTGDVLQGRLNSDRTISVAPQKIYNDALYGPFYIYPAVKAADGKIGVDIENPVTGTVKGDNEIIFGDWLIGARTAPASYVGYVANDMKITGPHGLSFPSAPVLTLDGEGTAASPYLIKNYGNLHELAMLTNAGESFSGKHIALDADLDLGAVVPASYVPVGTKAHPFRGSFDGRNHSVKNLHIDGIGAPYAGIFGYLAQGSSVANLRVESSSVYNVGDNTGMVAGFSAGKLADITVDKCEVVSEGKLAGGIAGLISGNVNARPVVRNCSVTAVNITGPGSVGGITGQAVAEISDCSVSGRLTQNGFVSDLTKDAGGIAGALESSEVTDCSVAGFITDSYGASSAGGIVGRSLKTSIIRSFSTATVTSMRLSSDVNVFAGGIAGYTRDGSVTDCFNAGAVVQNSNSEFTGGLVGYIGVAYTLGSAGDEMLYKTLITRSFNYGQVISASTNPRKGLYGDTYVSALWTGAHPEDLCFSDSYYDATIQPLNEEKFGRPTVWFTSGLPDRLSSSVWKAEKDRYPVLSKQSASDNSVLASVPVFLRAEDTVGKIRKSFSVTPDEKVKWAVADGGQAVAESDALKYADYVFSVKNRYANVSVMGMTADGSAAKFYNFSVVPKLFEGEGTAESPYLLKTAGDWQNLHKGVAETGQQHKGDYFAMANDVDFKDSDFHGVGYATGSRARFAGRLDGRGHTIHNLRINTTFYTKDDSGKTVVDTRKSIPYAGLFSVIEAGGAVENLNIAADCDFSFYAYGGPVAGACIGRIGNCRNYAPVSSSFTYNGGLVGLVATGAEISDSYNAGSVISPSSYIGGIAGVANPGSVITRCQNDGDIMAKAVIEEVSDVEGANFGGIAGLNLGTINHSVNNATVRAKSAVGGIAGVSNGYSGDGVIKNCVSNGFADSYIASPARGAIVGSVNMAVAENNYYDSSVNVNGGAQNQALKGYAGLSTSELVSGSLPQGLDASVFNVAAGAYPVLAKFASEARCKTLRSLYARFGKGQIRTNLRGDVTLTGPEGSAFTLVQNNDFAISDSKLTVKVPEEKRVAADTLRAVCGDVEKQFALSSIPSVLPGEGTPGLPYLIEKPADWNSLADFMLESRWDYPGSCFRIEADLDFKGDSIRALAVDGTSFNAILDGAGHKVKNYVYFNDNRSASSLQGPNPYLSRNLGLIGTLGSSGAIKNVTFDGEFTAWQNTAGIVGDNYGTIENVTNLGKVNNTAGNGIAGIAYYSQEGSVIKNTVFKGTVKSASGYAAGIVMYAYKGSELEGCSNQGTVTAAGEGCFGIAYASDAMMRSCFNAGKLIPGKGTAVGIVNTLGNYGCLTDCHNDVDIDLGADASGVYGIFNESTEISQSRISGCYNTGNLTAKTNVFGLCGEAMPGMVLEDCYNTGDITAVNGLACGLGNKLGKLIPGNDIPATLLRSYNTGNVTGSRAKCSGLFAEGRNPSVVTDCYNTGDIISTGHTGNYNGALISQASEVKMTRCFNTGDITSSGYAVGGITGIFSSNSVVTDCFNLGNVTSTYNGTNTNGNAGGITGYLAADPLVMTGCFNMGNVTGTRRVGGIVGGVLRTGITITKCYNAGKVTCTETAAVTVDGETRQVPMRSFTAYSNRTESGGVSISELWSDLYYDSKVNPGEEYRSFPGSAKTTAELAALSLTGTLNDHFAKPLDGGYPVLKFFTEKFRADDISAAALVLGNDNENFDFVTDPFILIAPEGAVWTAEDPATGASSSALKIENGIATPLSDAAVILRVSDSKNMLRKSFVLNLKPSQSSNIDSDFSGKEVANRTFYDLSGREVTHPVPGQVYIVRTVYIDGTVQTTKAIIRR